MRTRRRTSRAGVTAMIVVAVAVLLAACSDDEPRASQPEITVPSTTSTTAASSTTSTSEPTPERVEAAPPPDEPRPDIDVNVTYPSDFTEEQVEVVDAYRGFWHAVYVASDPPNPAHPLLPDFMTIDRLQAVQAGLQDAIARGVVIQIPEDASYRHLVMDVEISGEQAVIRDCGVDDAVVVDASTGALIDGDVVTRELEFEAERTGGSWRIGGRQPRTVHEWQGVAGCAEESS